MATVAELGAAIATRVRLIVDATTLGELTTQRDTSTSAEVTAKTDALSASVAGEIIDCLGTVDATDETVLGLGSEMVLDKLRSSYASVITPENIQFTNSLYARLKNIKECRSEGLEDELPSDASGGTIFTERTFTDLNNRFPSSSWE